MIVNIFILTLLIIASISDIRNKKISNHLLIAFGILVIPVFFWRCYHGQFLAAKSVPWGVLPGLVCLLLGKITRESIGYGDGYLISIIGMYMGLSKTIGLVITALFFIGLFSIGMLLFQKANRKTQIPFIPALLMAFGFQSMMIG